MVKNKLLENMEAGKDDEDKVVQLLVLPKEKDMELYNTRPGYPNNEYSKPLIPNTIDVETTIYSFQLPTGHYAITNPDIDFDGVLVRPFDNKGKFIDDGLVCVYAQSGLQGLRVRVYSGNTEFHNPNTPESLIRSNRKWSMKHILVPGDSLDVTLSASKVMDIKKSSVMLTFKVGRYRTIKVKLCKECVDKIEKVKSEDW